MKYLILLIVILVSTNCNNDDDTEPRTFTNVGYRIEGTDQEISIIYTNLEGTKVTDTTNVPWSKTFGSLTLAPGEEFNLDLIVKSLSKEKEELRAYIISDASGRNSAQEIQNGYSLEISLKNRFYNPSKDITFIVNDGGPRLYSIQGTDQSVEISYRDIDEQMVKDTLDLPWEKGFYLNIDPSESFQAILNVKSLSQNEETINAAIREVEETKTGTNLEINLTNNLPSRFNY